MSRQELAEAVNAYLWSEHGERASLDGNYIGKLERGEHRWPGSRYRKAFRAILGADNDADLGFYIVRTRSEEAGSRARPVSPDPDGQGRFDGSSSGLLAGLLSALSNYRSISGVAGGGRSLASVEVAAARMHQAYQRADYEAAGRVLPGLIQDSHASVIESSGDQRQRALRAQAVVYLAASKLATKAGDGQCAWLAADRAATAAQIAEAPALSAIAAYQVACALLRFPVQPSSAEDLAVTAAEDIARNAFGADADLVSARGSLLLLAALIAAQRGDHRVTQQRLSEAAAEAERLGRDGNRLWTAFGPTNVAIHRVSAAVVLGQFDTATEIGTRLDTSRLSRPLVGRRTQVHLDLAAACAMGRDGDSLAVLHLLEAERMAPQAVRVNVAARMLIADLLRRERSAVTPGLRPLAQRAGVEA